MTLSSVNHLIHSVAFLLPIYGSIAAPRTSTDLGRQIETEVRLAINERFGSAWIFRSAMVALSIAETLFSFGLFRLYGDVKQTDALVNEMKTHNCCDTHGDE